MTAVYIISVVLVLLAVWLFVVNRSVQRTNARLRAVIDNQKDYAFLVNEDFEVKETNFRLPPDGAPRVLGNVLHCKNAHDAGRCGEGEPCKHCPIRFVISKSFERKHDFDTVDACMEIYQDNQHVRDVDVSIDGRYVNIDAQPHMVVNVKDMAGQLMEHLPKILFASQNVELYERANAALRADFRLLHADTVHQVLHRLMMVAEYKFCALIADEQFLEENQVIMDLVNKEDHLPVIVFSNREIAYGRFTYIKENATAEQIRDCCIKVCCQH